MVDQSDVPRFAVMFVNGQTGSIFAETEKQFQKVSVRTHSVPTSPCLSDRNLLVCINYLSSQPSPSHESQDKCVKRDVATTIV